MKYNIPKEVTHVTNTLEKAGFEAFLVGGCVRDLLLDKKPKDWDVTTNATPEQIHALFVKTVYENKFGTVAVINENVTDETLKVVEVTPYRLESKYSDSRHPDEVRFTRNIEDDLKRRDFTINALAMNEKGITDLFHGKHDLETKTLRAVGKPEDRFQEDALRMMRAVRLASELGFHVEPETKKAIKNNAKLLKKISEERIRDELVKLIMSPVPSEGIKQMEEFDLLEFVIPELREGIDFEQNKSHIYTVFEHNLRSLDHSAMKGWDLEIRLSALLHDVGKPASMRFDKQKGERTFYMHEMIGAKMATKILTRLKFPKKTIERVAKFVRYHLFFSDTDKITLSAVRRIVRNVGPEDVWELMKVRFCDRVGMGRPKETPYRLRKYESMIEEAMRSPLSVGMLKIDGNDLMKSLGMAPGPKIGQILHILLEETLDAPENNTKKWLETRAKELLALSDKDLEALGQKAKETKNEAEEKEVEQIRSKWFVK